MTSSPPLAPLRLEPLLVERPWGGTHLAPRFGAVPDPRRPIGEAWLAGPDSRVLSGSEAGETLAEVARRHGASFVGRGPVGRYGDRMPLLVKLLDAAAPLSVQVHPDDVYALRHEAASGHLGKDEAWLMLATTPGAHVLWGWTRPVTADEVREAITTGAITSLLRRLPVRTGDVVVNAAGVVHAVGAGVLLYEVQQASDLTYRLYDYDRPGLDGRPRELHLDAALSVARLTPGGEPAPAPRNVGPGRVRLADTTTFSLERWQVGGGAPEPQRWGVSPRTLEVWTVLEGEAELEAAGARLALTATATVVVPASSGSASWRGDAVLVRATA
jgi:mannose-6-phosphate isomerase